MVANEGYSRSKFNKERGHKKKIIITNEDFEELKEPIMSSNLPNHNI